MGIYLLNLKSAGAARLLHERDPARSGWRSPPSRRAQDYIDEIAAGPWPTREWRDRNHLCPPTRPRSTSCWPNTRAGGLALVTDVRGTHRACRRAASLSGMAGDSQEALTTRRARSWQRRGGGLVRAGRGRHHSHQPDHERVASGGATSGTASRRRRHRRHARTRHPARRHSPGLTEHGVFRLYACCPATIGQTVSSCRES